MGSEEDNALCIAKALADYIQIKHGYAFKSEFFTESETDNILLTPGNVEIGGGFKLHKPKFYDGVVTEEFVFNEGDIFVAMTDLSKNADILGYPAKVPHLRGKRFLHNQRLGKIIFKKNSVITPNYLYWLMHTKEYREHVLSCSSGTTVKHTSPDRILSFSPKIPPISEQSSVSKILDNLDKKITLNIKISKILEEIARAIFKRWFIDFEFPNENGEPYKSSGGEMIDSPLGPIPKGWRVAKVNTLGDIICGKTPPKNQRVFYENANIPFIKIPDMHSQVFAVKTNDRLSCAAIKFMRKKLLPANSICVSCIATVGKVVMTSRESFTNQQINSIIPNRECLVYYTYFLMKELRNTLVQMASSGSATLNLNTKMFSDISIILPSELIILRFHETAKCLFRRILLNQSEMNTLISLRDTLLPKLMSGELRVTDIEDKLGRGSNAEST